MDIVEFLTARLDEEQRLAEAATQGEWKYQSTPRKLIGGDNLHYGVWTKQGMDVLLQDKIRAERVSSGDAEFIAYNDPARVLADVAAKRRILELATDATGLDLRVDGEFAVGVRDESTDPYLGDLIRRALAQPYADHPDFNPAWKVAE